MTSQAILRGAITLALAVLACSVPEPVRQKPALEGGGSGGAAGDGAGGSTGGLAGSVSSGGTITIAGTGGITNGGSGGGTGGGGIIEELPADFTAADTGGWKLGEQVTGGDGAGGEGGGPAAICANTLTGVVRDFYGYGAERHPDFEMDLHNPDYMLLPGIADAILGSDSKPVYGPDGPTNLTTGADGFDQWYRTEDGVNQAYLLTLFLEPGPNGLFTFESNAFFPLDGSGFGNEGQAHNFHFTFELHTEFKYNGGENFTFIGDDDVFVFINGNLAVDLGGVHPIQTGSIDVDTRAAEFGMVVGETYPLDMFHAERHTGASNFRVETTLEFTNCGIFVPDIPK